MNRISMHKVGDATRVPLCSISALMRRISPPRGTSWPWPLQTPCRTSPACSSDTIVLVSAHCSVRFFDVAVADGGSQFNWLLWRGHA